MARLMTTLLSLCVIQSALAGSPSQNGWTASLQTALKKKEFLIIQLTPEDSQKWTIIPLSASKQTLSSKNLKTILVPESHTPKTSIKDLLEEPQPLSKELPKEIQEALTPALKKSHLFSKVEEFTVERKTKPSELLFEELVYSTFIKTKTGKTLVQVEELPAE